MTQKEAIKFLSNTKVYVNGKSKEIQEKLFSLGFEWRSFGKSIHNENKPFLFMYKDMEICYSDDMSHFKNRSELREITVDDIIGIDIDKEIYRSFKTENECWNEMLKHQPFGWLINRKFKFRTTIRCVAHNDITLSDGSIFNFSKHLIDTHLQMVLHSVLK